MGRTNLIILALGLFACVALSLMMKFAFEVKEEESVHPAVEELYSVFSGQISRRPTLKITDKEKQRVATLGIVPAEQVAAGDVPRLANTMGRFLARFRGETLAFDRLIVVATAGETSRSFEVPLRGHGGLQRPVTSSRKPARRKAAQPPKAPK